MSRVMASAVPVQAVGEAVNLLESAKLVMSEAQRLGAVAESEGDIRTALQALREYARGTELIHKMHDTSVQHARIERNEEWIELRDAILAALEPYEEAYGAVRAAIERVRAKKTPSPRGGF